MSSSCGVFRTFEINGNEEYFVNNLIIEGLYKVYYPHNILYSECEYINNYKIGIENLYFKNATILCVLLHYNNGNTINTYNSRGKLQKINNYLNDMTHGIQTIYDLNGNFQNEEYIYGIPQDIPLSLDWNGNIVIMEYYSNIFF